VLGVLAKGQNADSVLGWSCGRTQIAEGGTPVMRLHRPGSRPRAPRRWRIHSVSSWPPG